MCVSPKRLFFVFIFPFLLPFYIFHAAPKCWLKYITYFGILFKKFSTCRVKVFGIFYLKWVNMCYLKTVDVDIMANFGDGLYSLFSTNFILLILLLANNKTDSKLDLAQVPIRDGYPVTENVHNDIFKIQQSKSYCVKLELKNSNN